MEDRLDKLIGAIREPSVLKKNLLKKAVFREILHLLGSGILKPMLGVGSGLIIHADGKSVAVEIISATLGSDPKSAAIFQVYRRKDISHVTANKIVQAAIRYYSQKYRFSSFFSKIQDSDTTQFCSRLVAHAYRSVGVELTLRPDHQVLPVDLYRICQSDPWEDVSPAFVQQPMSPDSDDVIGPIEIPGKAL